MNELESLRREIYRLQADILAIKRQLESHRPLGVAELAAAIHRGRNYVGAMRRQGFPMPNGVATVADARQWLKEHPNFRVHLSASTKLLRKPKPARLRT